MAIDNPKQAYEQQYMGEEGQSPFGLTLATAKIALPQGGWLLDFVKKIHDRFSRPSAMERATVMWETIWSEIESVRETKVNLDDFTEAVQLAIRSDMEAFNDNKRARYIKLIGNALRSDTKIDDIATFVRTVEQLNERDVAVLKVLNQVMNKDSDWKPQSSPGGDVWKVHPNVFIHRRQELALQVAIALGQPVEKNTFSRDEGYMICTRLQGFGLAHEVQPGARELPLTDYTFQLSTQGIRLLKLLGENVPNFDHYVRS